MTDLDKIARLAVISDADAAGLISPGTRADLADRITASAAGLRRSQRARSRAAAGAAGWSERRWRPAWRPPSSS